MCDVSEVVRDRMVFWAALAGDQNRPHRVIGAQLRIPVRVPRAELAAALDAVIGNVFRYTPQGTAFEVAVSRRDGYVAIRIDDAGPGIADPDRALRRGASDQGSTGLGLDIARRVALQANGSVSIDRARLGGASVVMLLADAEATPGRSTASAWSGRLAREAREQRAGAAAGPGRVPPTTDRSPPSPVPWRALSCAAGRKSSLDPVNDGDAGAHRADRIGSEPHSVPPACRP